MLRDRVVTALVLAPLILLLVWFSSPLMLTLLLAIVAAIGALEWLRLCQIENDLQRWWFVGAILLVGIAASLIPSIAIGLTIIAVLFWLFFSFLLLKTWRPEHPVWPIGKSLSGALIITSGWVATVQHKLVGEGSPSYLITLLLLIWAADTGAYFAGKNFGKTKLAPRISPGKTIEGLVGGLLGSSIIAALSGVLWLQFGGFKLIIWMLLCLVVVFFSVMGDLAESAAKREAGVKDSGSLLPGHGGMLDRVDSLLAAAPFMLAGLMWLDRMS